MKPLFGVSWKNQGTGKLGNVDGRNGFDVAKGEGSVVSSRRTLDRFVKCLMAMDECMGCDFDG